MLALEVGPGSGRRYGFRPRVPCSYTPIFLDVEPPTPELRKWDWVVGDAQRLPFRSDCFDLVIASHVIEHLNDPEAFVRECYRVLKVGGLLEIRAPNFLSVNARADPSHRHVLNFVKLYRMLRKAGFRVLLEFAAGSRIRPRLLRLLLSVAMNMVCEEIRIKGVKK